MIMLDWKLVSRDRLKYGNLVATINPPFTNKSVDGGYMTMTEEEPDFNLQTRLINELKEAVLGILEAQKGVLEAAKV